MPVDRSPAISHFLSLNPPLFLQFLPFPVPVWFLILPPKDFLLSAPNSRVSLSFLLTRSISWLHPLLQTSSIPSPPPFFSPYIPTLAPFRCNLCRAHTPVHLFCHWQLEIIPVWAEHPIVHGGCQVPRCHGNRAELSRPVDIYRVETPTCNLNQVAEGGGALWLCQIRAENHWVLNGLIWAIWAQPE